MRVIGSGAGRVSVPPYCGGNAARAGGTAAPKVSAESARKTRARVRGGRGQGPQGPPLPLAGDGRGEGAAKSGVSRPPHPLPPPLERGREPLAREFRGRIEKSDSLRAGEGAPRHERLRWLIGPPKGERGLACSGEALRSRAAR